MELFIASPPDFAHASLADFGEYLVFSESEASHLDIITGGAAFRMSPHQEADSLLITAYPEVNSR
jgi:hypothetical protein